MDKTKAHFLGQKISSKISRQNRDYILDETYAILKMAANIQKRRQSVGQNQGTFLGKRQISRKILSLKTK